jgi:transcriptional regulator with XRE-family HTH domain
MFSEDAASSSSQSVKCSLPPGVNFAIFSQPMPHESFPMASLGERIRERRMQLKWTQDVLADKAHLSKGFLSDLENNNRSVGADRLLDIARVLGVSLDYLMKGEPDASVQLQVIIPQRLSEFAKRESLPFNHALALLEMRRQIVAHRSIGRSEDPEDFDWERFYKSVKEFLP